MTTKQKIEDSNLDQELLRIGHQVIARQKEENFGTAWRNHWRAAAWSLFISMALWMEGYDTSILGSYYGLPQFKAVFGTMVDGKLKITNETQVGIGNTSTCGQLIGLVITGICQEWIGSKKTFLGGMLFMIATIFLAVFCQNIAMLYVAEFFMGIPWGMFQTLTTAYAAEICPINMRGYLAAWASMGWGGGRFLASGVTRATIHYTGDWAWRTPWAVQWIWPVPLALTIWMAPESPWWLVRKGRYEEAKEVVRRSARPGFYAEGEIDGYVEYMKHTDALDRAEKASGKFADLFKGTNLRRTEIQLGVWIAQLWNGNAITGLNVQFFENAGMTPEFAFNFNMIIQALSVVGVAVSWVLLRYFGRRPIYNWGIVSIIVANLIIGALGVTKKAKTTSYAAGAFMTWINFAFHFSLGPVCYTIVGELPASRLRARSIVMGRFVYVVNGIVVNSINPYTTNIWGAKAGFFWMGTGILCFIWCFFRMPETGGFSFAELDILFANKVPARKFTKVSIDEQFAIHRETHGISHGEVAYEEKEKAETEHAELK
ncbi:general substrate transporter [Kockovaella imperatae]|uniref:General substrate transporter n=1 Tax=Kockovaella imperatae TaxID=4999 RepID=A0A1Y1UC33_9TREE|nr:general substrate transporter [Kockovaella imperatae]ORX35608.1 general substrate transporter [Kockovaella imperatae]